MPISDFYFNEGLNVKLPRKKENAGIVCKENMALDSDIETCLVLFFLPGTGELATFFSPSLAKGCLEASTWLISTTQ